MEDNSCSGRYERIEVEGIESKKKERVDEKKSDLKTQRTRFQRGAP